MTLVRFEHVSLDFGDQMILRDAGFSIEPGERVCLIGRNGAGKSTTLKLISGELDPDQGEIIHKSSSITSQLTQTLPIELDQTVEEFVTHGLDFVRRLVEDYHRRSSTELDAQGLRDLEGLHRRIDALNGWNIELLVDKTMTELSLPRGRKLAELSGGWRRRAALAKALVGQPDLLLLDEPTNHLDLATIDWLENVVMQFAGAVLFITHDRSFLRRLATRIVEIDRGQLTSWPGDYDNFLRRKEKALEDESRANALFDKKLAQEEVWIRQGIKARRTRNEGRARALMALRHERAERLTRDPSARIHIEEADQSGRKVIQAKNVAFAYGEETLIRNFSTRIMRGDRIGLVGNNGVGKTTLLRLLLGELQPQQGVIKHGTNLEVGYFDQLRQTLDPEKSVADNVADGRTYIRLNGKDRHIVGYLKGFLFSPKRAATPVKALSGGERNRVILAKLFTKPANLLVLDEPTNDLDMETLEVLEQRLTDYSGTLIIVSHDRTFLDNVVTSILVFEENGQLQEYVGGYSDWARHGRKLAEVDDASGRDRQQSGSRDASAPRRKTKLSYKEQRELEQLPAAIESLEAAIAALEKKISAADFYSQPHEEVQAVLQRLTDAQAGLDRSLERWTVLADLQEQLQAEKKEL